MLPLVLASASPRRRRLLRQIGLSFRTAAADLEENLLPSLDIEEAVQELAYQKARAVAAREPGTLVLGADTVVVLDRMVLGKPADTKEACRILAELQGREHQVITGVALVEADTGRQIRGREVTRVWMRTLSDREIAGYAATGEPLDKAGAYGIQGKGALLVERIDGCYFNVVGLPLVRVAEMLKEFGIRPLEWGGIDGRIPLNH